MCSSAQRDKLQLKKIPGNKADYHIIMLRICSKRTANFNNESISETFEDGVTMIRFQVSFQTGELAELWRSAQLHRRF